MKKLISIAIVAFVFSWILAVGFSITKQAIISDTSNAKLIADIMSVAPVPHNATTTVPNRTASAQATTTLASMPAITVLQPSQAPKMSTTAPIAVNTIETQKEEESQELEILEATLIHMQMTTGSIQ